jgi:hypothetical protein
MQLGKQEFDTPLILNLAQKSNQNPEEFLFGAFRDQVTKTENGVTRKNVKWKPHDVANRQQKNNKELVTTVLNRNVVQIGQGVMSPRKIYVLLPDQVSEMPQTWSKMANHNMGRFFAQFYQEQAARKTLEILAGHKKRTYSMVEDAIKNQELDDELQNQVQKAVDREFDRAEKAGTSSSS